MKLLHTADLHLGKIVNSVSMLPDQRYILEQITAIIEKEQIDGIILAGDLYDRAIPQVEAVNLLNDILFQWNVKKQLPIFAISGNHDSADRLSFGSAWYENHQFYMAGKLTAEINPIPFMDSEIWLIPFHEPAVLRDLTGDKTIHSYENAMQKIVQQIKQKWNPAKCQIFVGHAFISGGIPSDSERQLSIGHVDRISTDCLADFTYTALGHLHHPHAINHPTIFYSGSPLKYSFSEVNDRKSVRIVEFSGVKLKKVREIPLKPKRDLRIIEGTLEELTTEIAENPNDYLQVNLTDQGALVDPMGKLRQFYPNILHLERTTAILSEGKPETFTEVLKKEDIPLFAQFFEYASGQVLTEEQKEKMQLILNEVNREAKDI
ncbi:exonuclease SbcCD subunit D [Listeria sp. PSOL-1]|uniref:exonuclease SbcCD subunit D n=1 Tax=Listeria sp. PSOL-1 TaxID=1844999 RepID=UPI0013D3B0AC|nr:exonuclease SbcCD subunit D [Listeria sp. PSOL-1]